MCMREIRLHSLGKESHESVWCSQRISHHIVFGGMIKEPQAFSVSQKLEVPYAFQFSFVCCYFFMFLLVYVRTVIPLGEKLLRQQVRIKERRAFSVPSK